MTQDLKDMCIIEKSSLARLVEACNYEYGIDDADAMYALGQDLSGTMNVPIELTEAMMERALEVLGRMHGFELKLVAINFYKAMLSAAQKESE